MEEVCSIDHLVIVTQRLKENHSIEYEMMGEECGPCPCIYHGVIKSSAALIQFTTQGKTVENTMCDCNHCIQPDGEVRLLPTGGDGNMVVCYACYIHEAMSFLERAKEINEGFLYIKVGASSLPKWTSLKVYEGS